MSSKLKTLNNLFNNIVQKNRRFLCFTMAIEFQKEAIADFESLLKKTSQMKKAIINQKNESLSNQLLSLEYLLLTYINEMKMYVYLKEDKMNEAWDSLVDAQLALRTAFQADEVVSIYEGEAYTRKLELIEQIFFPHIAFMSPEIKVQSSKCSICGNEYGTCNHVAGKPYMGEICYIITRGIEFKGISILTNMVPASKHHRVTEISDNGYMRDVLTWRIVKRISQELKAKIEETAIT